VNIPRSLESALLLRLALVLILAFAVVAAWFRLHLGHIETAHPQPIVHEVMAEFFTDIAWVVPVVLVIALAFTAFTLRRSLTPLREISARAAAIRPGTLDKRLPESGLPAEVVPLVRATNEMLDRVEAGFALQRRFTANAAHELRTPLQLLSAGLEALGRDPKIEPLQEDVRRMSRLVAQLLAVARLDARKEPASGKADLSKAAASTLSFLAPLAVTRGVSVALDRAPEPTIVRGDAVLIEDLLCNLVENAVAVSPAGAEVTVAVCADGRLDVIDQGPGIAPEHRERVFERFWRAPDAPAGGSGLGLAIVKETADACGATLCISDGINGGTIVSVTFLLSQNQHGPLEGSERSI
jgi:signal transduction histidine kinase